MAVPSWLPDRFAELAANDRAAAAAVAPDRSPECSMTHADEILTSHTATPGTGVGAPAVDKRDSPMLGSATIGGGVSTGPY